MPVSFKCPACTSALQVTSKKIGSTIECPKCSQQILVPEIRGTSQAEKAWYKSETENASSALRPASPNIAPNPENKKTLWRDPVKLTIFFAGFFLASLVLFITTIVMMASREKNPSYLLLIALFLGFITLISGVLTLQLLVAKQRAISGQSVKLLFGLARMIVWEQNEGLILLRDKKISELIEGPIHGGGLRIIYPLIGEELKARVPLAVQLTWFEDQRVLTRESIQLTVKIALWWQVSNLATYFYEIDSNVNSLDNSRDPGKKFNRNRDGRDRDKRSSAEVWIQTLAESCIRQLISDTSTFLIVSKRVSAALPKEMMERMNEDPDNPEAGPATPDIIATQLMSKIQPRVQSYGITLDRIEIQEIQLPPSIQRAVDEVWIASTQPKKTGHEAEALQNRLKVLCEMLGPQAAAMMEIVDKMPSGSYYGNPLGTLNSMMAQLATNPDGHNATNKPVVAKRAKPKQ